jgi:Fe-S cluster assembly protein SufD
VAPFFYPGCRTLVFVNGRHASELSAPGTALPGLHLGSLAAALADPARAGEVLAGLGREAKTASHPFVAANTALFEDGALVVVGRQTVVPEPIHLIFVNLPGPDPVAVHPRVLVLAEELAQATVIETHVGPAGGHYLSTAVTEVVAAPSSVIDLVKVQQESLEAAHLATVAAWHDRASTYRLHSISFGGGLVRNEIQSVLDGEGVEAVLDGLYLVRGEQHVDHQMRVIHAKPHCNSHELFKGILEDKAHAVFNGLIRVEPGAQKTDAKQTSRNLILSRDAVANANPQLEIFADDVKCTHGSTVGQLDPTAVFYLRSRGIGEEAARSLLTYAFAHEVVDGIRIDAVRADLEEFLFRRLPKGEIVRQAV